MPSRQKTCNVVKILHAADLHIDSPLRGLAQYEGAPWEQLRQAPRDALRNLVNEAIDEGVDLALFAGDIYDGSWKDFNTGLFFSAEIARLTEAGVAVVVLAGNHDAESKITKRLTLPANAVRLGHDRPETLHFEGLGVAVHGQRYAQPAVTDNLARHYPDPEPGAFNIGLLHTALTGRDGHEPYAPCTLEDLANKGYDYWALGHVHRREVVSENPWVVFPGNLQGRHAKETGPKGYTLLTVEDGEVISVEERHVDVARWARCEVDASSAGSPTDVLDLAQAALGKAVGEAEGRTVAARVVITGTTDAHDALLSEHEELEADLRARSFEIGDLWIEKFQIATNRALDLAGLRKSVPAIGAVLEAIAALRDHPDELVELHGGTFESLRERLPLAARGADGIDPQSELALRNALEAAEARLLTIMGEGGRE
jgi:DNA repair exonuclease SbcCD nuclease subunit